MLLCALTFGNNVFSFYRYYGLSSSIFSQICAVALVRIALEVAKRGQLSIRTVLGQSSAIYLLPLACLLLLALIAFQHMQGMGIIGFSVGSIALWRLLAWKRSAGWWIAGLAIALSIAAIQWWPRHPAVDKIYHDQGWLTSWYGYNFTWPSPTFGHALGILGVFGIVNFLAGVILVLRNHVAGWLTVGPVIALVFPFIALPLASRIAAEGAEFLTFQRMLFAIPSGLALICCSSLLASHLATRRGIAVTRSCGVPAVILITAGLMLVSPGIPYGNRSWHFLSMTAQDLKLGPLLARVESTEISVHGAKHSLEVSTNAVAFSLNAISQKSFFYRERPIYQSVTESLNWTLALLASSRPTNSAEHPTLTRDPSAAIPSEWISVDGSPPDFINGIEHFPAGSTALQNPTGRMSAIFTHESIPLNHKKAYRLELSLRQSSGTQSTAYLAVAWYNDEDRLLVSNDLYPNGADLPIGWINGTYSYFGLAGTAAPTTWTTYRISFGAGEAARIPSNAKKMRIGALLNYNLAPNSVIQLTNVRAWPKSNHELIADGTFSSSTQYHIIVPFAQMVYSHSSQAAQLSRHWPAQRLALDLAGDKELKAAAHSLGAIPADSHDAYYKFLVTPFDRR